MCSNVRVLGVLVTGDDGQCPCCRLHRPVSYSAVVTVVDEAGVESTATAVDILIHPVNTVPWILPLSPPEVLFLENSQANAL